MAGFPPKKGNSNNSGSGAQKPERPAISTGAGGLKKSLQIKNAGIKKSPGLEKHNSAA